MCGTLLWDSFQAGLWFLVSHLVQYTFSTFHCYIDHVAIYCDFSITSWEVPPHFFALQAAMTVNCILLVNRPFCSLLCKLYVERNKVVYWTLLLIHCRCLRVSFTLLCVVYPTIRTEVSWCSHGMWFCKWPFHLLLLLNKTHVYDERLPIFPQVNSNANSLQILLSVIVLIDFYDFSLQFIDCKLSNVNWSFWSKIKNSFEFFYI